MGLLPDYVAGVLSGGAIVGVSVLCYYGLKGSKKTVRRTVRLQANQLNEDEENDRQIWPGYVRNRINKTYLYFGGSIALTAGSALVVCNNPNLMAAIAKNTIPVFVCELIALVGTQIWVRSIPYTEKNSTEKHVAWILHCCSNGAILAPLTFIVGGPVIYQASLYTAAIVGGFSAVAACSPNRKYLNLGGALGAGLGVVFVASLGTMLFSRNSVLGEISDSISLYGGLGLFSMFLLYDTQRLIDNAENIPEDAFVPFDPINQHLAIYYDAMNLLVRIVRILSKDEQKRKKKKNY